MKGSAFFAFVFVLIAGVGNSWYCYNAGYSLGYKAGYHEASIEGFHMAARVNERWLSYVGQKKEKD